MQKSFWFQLLWSQRSLSPSLSLSSFLMHLIVYYSIDIDIIYGNFEKIYPYVDCTFKFNRSSLKYIFMMYFVLFYSSWMLGWALLLFFIWSFSVISTIIFNRKRVQHLSGTLGTFGDVYQNIFHAKSPKYKVLLIQLLEVYEHEMSISMYIVQIYPS